MDKEELSVYPGDLIFQIEFKGELTEKQSISLIDEINGQVTLSSAIFELKLDERNKALLVIRGIRLRGPELVPLLNEFLDKSRPLAAAYRVSLSGKRL